MAAILPEHREKFYKMLCESFEILGQTAPDNRDKIWPIVAKLLEVVGPDYFKVMLEADRIAALRFLGPKGD